MTREQYIRDLHENPKHKDLTPAERHQRICEFVEFTTDFDGSNESNPVEDLRSIIDSPIFNGFNRIPDLQLTPHQQRFYSGYYDQDYQTFNSDHIHLTNAPNAVTWTSPTTNARAAMYYHNMESG